MVYSSAQNGLYCTRRLNHVFQQSETDTVQQKLSESGYHESFFAQALIHLRLYQPVVYYDSNFTQVWHGADVIKARFR